MTVKNLRLYAPDKNLAFSLDSTGSYIAPVGFVKSTVAGFAKVGTSVFLGPNFDNQPVDTVNPKNPMGISIEISSEFVGKTGDAITGLSFKLQTANTDSSTASDWTDVQIIDFDAFIKTNAIPAGTSVIQLVQIGALTGNWARIAMNTHKTTSSADAVLAHAPLGTVTSYMSPMIANDPVGGYQDNRRIKQFK